MFRLPPQADVWLARYSLISKHVDLIDGGDLNRVSDDGGGGDLPKGFGAANQQVCHGQRCNDHQRAADRSRGALLSAEFGGHA